MSRDFAKSAVADATSSDYSEWFIGHSGSTYYNKKEIERVMLFLSCPISYSTITGLIPRKALTYFTQSGSIITYSITE